MKSTAAAPAVQERAYSMPFFLGRMLACGENSVRPVLVVDSGKTPGMELVSAVAG